MILEDKMFILFICLLIISFSAIYYIIKCGKLKEKLEEFEIESKKKKSNHFTLKHEIKLNKWEIESCLLTKEKILDIKIKQSLTNMADFIFEKYQKSDCPYLKVEKIEIPNDNYLETETYCITLKLI